MRASLSGLLVLHHYAHTWLCFRDGIQTTFLKAHLTERALCI